MEKVEDRRFWGSRGKEVLEQQEEGFRCDQRRKGKV